MIYTPVLIIIILVLIVILFKQKYKDFFTITRIKSTVDYNMYPVASKYVDKEKAANLIGDLNLFTIKLIAKLREVYIDNVDIIKKSRYRKEYRTGAELTNILFKRYSAGSLQENDPVSIDATSYTTNKGEIISFCLREKVSGKNNFHDLHTLQFVLLHELAHIITKEYNHSKSFWTNFKFLLEFCERYNLYKTKNYDLEKTPYCGMYITYNPINDKQLVSYFDN